MLLMLVAQLQVQKHDTQVCTETSECWRKSGGAGFPQMLTVLLLRSFPTLGTSGGFKPKTSSSSATNTQVTAEVSAPALTPAPDKRGGACTCEDEVQLGRHQLGVLRREAHGRLELENVAMRPVGAEEDLLFLQPETPVYDRFIVVYRPEISESDQ